VWPQGGPLGAQCDNVANHDLIRQMSVHHHDPSDAKRGHARASARLSILGTAVALTAGFAVVEAVGGVLSGSLALLSDAAHMGTDALSLVLALLAQIWAKRAPTSRHSYGHGRIEALAAFLNSLAMLGLTVWIAAEAITRFSSPKDVQGMVVIWIAALGLAVNIAVAVVLSRDEQDLNVRAALVHVMGDLLGSLAALLAGVVILYGGPSWVDPLLSILVCLLITKSAGSLLRQSYGILMEHVPASVDFDLVAADLREIKGVCGVHNLHIWEISPGHIALTAHLELNDLGEWPLLRVTMQHLLREKYGIDHATIQPELSSDE